MASTLWNRANLRGGGVPGRAALFRRSRGFGGAGLEARPRSLFFASVFPEVRRLAAALGVLACVAGWCLGRGQGWFWLSLCAASGVASAAAGGPAVGLCFVLGWASACDLRDMEVPDLPWWAACAAWVFLGGAVPRPAGLTGGVFALLFGLLLQFLAGRLYGEAAYGGADVKLGTVAGLYLGVPGFLLALLLGSLFGLAHGLWLRRGGKLGPRQPFPFIPALGMGVLAAASALPLWERLLLSLAL